MMRFKLKNILLLVAVLVAGVWLFIRLAGLPSLVNIFAAKPVVIDKTPIIIKSIKGIAQLVTVTAYDEVVVDSLVYYRSAAYLNAFKVLSPMAMLPSIQKQLVIIGKGKVLAGTNLQKLDSTHIRVSSDTIWLQLPQAEILQAIINPSDFETFEERGVWSYDEVTAVKIKARQKLIDRAVKQNILPRANAKAKSTIETLLTNAGYKVVKVWVQ